jgi:DNA primase
MAYISIHGEPKTNAVALCCLYDGTLEQYLKENSHINRVILCLDNDQWGREAAERLAAKYQECGYSVSSYPPLKGKDWAEYAEKRKNQSRGR